MIDFATRKVEATWPIPGGGSPDMGNVSADGKQLWLSGRYDDVVYVFDTTTGAVKTIPVGKEPHGLTVWPQPGRYSLGHTGQHALTRRWATGYRRSENASRSARGLASPIAHRLIAALAMTVQPAHVRRSAAGTSIEPSARW